MRKSNGLQLDDSLQRRIEEFAHAKDVSAEEIVREALEQYFANQETWEERAERLGLLGCVQGTPPDLSTNPKYFEGFGCA